MRTALIFTLLLGVSNVARAETVYYVDVFNNSKNSVAALSVSPAGSDDFQAVPIGRAPLPGGGDSTTIAIRKSDVGCLRQLRAVFVNGDVLVQRDYDICKYRSWHIGRHLRGRGQTAFVKQP